MTPRPIGADFQDAVNWAQTRLRTTRPIAEQTVWSAVHAGAMIWDRAAGAVCLLEDDDELENRKKALVRKSNHAGHIARKWSRLQFKNRNRFAKKSEGAQRDHGHGGPPTLPEPALGRETLFEEASPPESYRRLLLRLLQTAGCDALS